MKILQSFKNLLPTKPPSAAKKPMKGQENVDFIFIHINKNGGCSIEQALDLKTKHITAQDTLKRIGSLKWSNNYTFAFVRNPWSRALSQYRYRINMNKNNLAETAISFKEWVSLTYEQKHPNYIDNPVLFIQQLDWISNDNNEIIVNYIGRFESLEKDFSTICKKIKRTCKLQHLNSSGPVDYRLHYDDQTKNIIQEHFKDDIRAFNYTF